MAIALAIFGIAFAAFCVWLTVRIVNRRERWAKWTAVGLTIGLPVVYVLSVGPAVWLMTHDMLSESMAIEISLLYVPLQYVAEYAPEPVGDGLRWYAGLWVKTTTGYDPAPDIPSD